MTATAAAQETITPHSREEGPTTAATDASQPPPAPYSPWASSVWDVGISIVGVLLLAEVSSLAWAQRETLIGWRLFEFSRLATVSLWSWMGARLGLRLLTLFIGSMGLTSSGAVQSALKRLSDKKSTLATLSVTLISIALAQCVLVVVFELPSSAWQEVLSILVALLVSATAYGRAQQPSAHAALHRWIAWWSSIGVIRRALQLLLAISLALLVVSAAAGLQYAVYAAGWATLSSHDGIQEYFEADGTKFVIDNQSVISVHNMPRLSQIDLLQGQLSVRTAPKMDRPLDVHVGNLTFKIPDWDVHDFVVRRVDDTHVEVLSLEGDVTLYAEDGVKVSDKGMVLPHDSLASVTLPLHEVTEESVHILALQPQEIVARQSWMMDMQMFVDEPLADVIRDANRYLEPKLTIDDSAMADRKVSFTIHKRMDHQELSDALYRQFHICTSDLRLVKCTSENINP